MSYTEKKEEGGGWVLPELHFLVCARSARAHCHSFVCASNSVFLLNFIRFIWLGTMGAACMYIRSR